MDCAPKDGTTILCAYHNGCDYEYRVVYWDEVADESYPWNAVDQTNRWPEHRMDCWTEISPPNWEPSDA